MHSPGSVTRWLRALETGDEDAARHLWNRYSSEMHDVAHRRLRRLRRRDIVDAEDIVISSFASVCLAARNGLLSNVANRDQLWGLLIVATQRKVGHYAQYATAKKREASALIDVEEQLTQYGSRLERMVDTAPSPDAAAIMAEQAEALLARLKDADLRAVAIMRLAGHTNEEIAAELGYTRRTIQRMLSMIKDYWADVK